MFVGRVQYLSNNALFTSQNLIRYFCSKCGKMVCQKPIPKKTIKEAKAKKSFWEKLRSCHTEDAPRPRDETCIPRSEAEKLRQKTVPDLGYLGGKTYDTCGSAFVVKKDTVPRQKITLTDEEKIIKNIEALPELKYEQDPMPPFESVEKRMIDLCEKKLHPFYRMYTSLRKQNKETDAKTIFVYRSRSGPCDPEEIPMQLRFNKDLLEKKNIFADVKKVEPPMQLIGKLIEINKNQRSTLKRRANSKDNDADKLKCVNK